MIFHNPDDIKDDFLVAGKSIKEIIKEKNHPEFIANEVENLLKQKEFNMREMLSSLNSASVFLYERGQYNIARVISERTVWYCVKVGDKNTLCRCLIRIANCYYFISDDFFDFTDKAILCYNAALKVAVEINDKKSQELCYFSIELIQMRL